MGTNGGNKVSRDIWRNDSLKPSHDPHIVMSHSACILRHLVSCSRWVDGGLWVGVGTLESLVRPTNSSSLPWAGMNTGRISYKARPIHAAALTDVVWGGEWDDSAGEYTVRECFAHSALVKHTFKLAHYVHRGCYIIVKGYVPTVWMETFKSCSTLTYGHVKVKLGRLVMYKQAPCDLKLLVLAYLNTRKALRGLRTWTNFPLPWH